MLIGIGITIDVQCSHSAEILIPVAGSVAWWKAYSGIVMETGVASMADQSGNGRHLLQTNSSNQPSRNLISLNGHDTIETDGISQFLQNTFIQASPMTCYMLIRQKNWTNGNVLFTGSTTALLCYQLTANPALRFSNGGSEIIVGAGIDVNAWKVLTWVIDGASSFIRINNGAPITGINGVDSISGMYLGGYITGVAYTNLEFCEGMIYAGAHGVSDQDQNIAYLMKIAGLL